MTGLVIDPDEPRLTGLRLREQRILPGQPYEKLEVDDVVLDGCDLVGLVADQGRARRLVITGGRLRGITWGAVLLDEIEVSDASGDDIALRFATIRRMVVRDSRLPGIDFTESTFERVRFERCDLRGARFDHCRMQQVRFVGCDLAGVTGADALRGASVHPDDAWSMTISLATALGLIVEEDDGLEPGKDLAP